MNIIFTLKKITIKLFNFLNLFPTSLTTKEDLQALLKLLRPLNPGINLIRLGPMSDGGYLVPDDLNNIKACFSPGVCEESGFEKDCAKRGMKVFMADLSVDGPATTDERFHFIKKYIGAYTSANFISINDWVAGVLPNNQDELILQIDIEGYEYEAFLSLSEDLLNKFRIIVCEFHNLHNLGSRPFFNIASSVFNKLSIHHQCVHAHPNNSTSTIKIHGLEIPTVMELTYLRKDRVLENTPYQKYPHNLDVDCAKKKTIVLPDCWWKN